jgi:hypothetical protein
MVACINPSDARVNARLADGLDHPELAMRLWAAYALGERIPVDDATLVRLAWHLNDPSTDVRERLRWIFTTQAPLSDPVREAVAALDPTLPVAQAARAKRRRWWPW